MLRRWHYMLDGPQPEDVSFVASARILDIPNTLVAAINNLRPNCVAVVIRYALGVNGRLVADVERAARHKGLRVLWMRRRAPEQEKGEQT